MRPIDLPEALAGTGVVARPPAPRKRVNGAGGPPEAAGPTIRATPFRWRDPREIPPRKWLYGRHYVRGYVTATIAPAGLGKTSLALVEAVAMATGRNLLGVGVPRRLRVWYWNGEDPIEEIERRVAAICLHYGISAQEIAGQLFVNSGRDTRIIVAEKKGEAVVVAAPLVQALAAEIREHGIDVLIIDPFVSSHGVPENDNGAIDRVAKTWALDIADPCRCAVELVHHVRKPPAGASSDYAVDDARGAVSLIGAARSARVLNFMSKEDADKLSIDARERLRYFRVDDGKRNMAPPAEGAVWRKLVSVALGNATADDPEDWVQVVTAWTMPGIFDGLQPADLGKVQAAIRAGDWAENIQAANWAGYAIAEALGLPYADKGDKQRLKNLLAGWLASGALKVVRQHDGNKGRDKPMIVVGEVSY
jgi:hypothetical protein